MLSIIGVISFNKMNAMPHLCSN